MNQQEKTFHKNEDNIIQLLHRDLGDIYQNRYPYELKVFTGQLQL